MSLVLNVLASLGAIYGVTLIFQLVRFITYWTRSGSLSRYNYKLNNQNPWAFVSGASDGIGLGLAHELASSGFNVMLHGRNPAKLEAAKKSILSECPNVEVGYTVADVCVPGDEMIAKVQGIYEDVKDLHLIVLINNVGGPPPNIEPLYRPFDEYVAWEIDDTISMNIRFNCHLTSLLIPLLTRNKKPALIMNIGSMADTGLPYIAMYSGTKGFIDSWMLALRREMKAEGRDVEALCVLPIKVTGTSFRTDKADLMMPDRRTFAKSTLGRIGGRRAITQGYWIDGLMANVVNNLPEGILFGFMLKSIREEAEKDKKRGRGDRVSLTFMYEKAFGCYAASGTANLHLKARLFRHRVVDFRAAAFSCLKYMIASKIELSLLKLCR